MTVAAVRTHRVSQPLHTPFVTALRRATTVESLLVEVIDSDGRSGFGEAPEVWAVTGANIGGSRACVEEVLGPRLIGRDADDLVANCRLVARAVYGNEGAKSAVDVALHDLAARRLGVPLVRLLGGSALRIPTDVTISAGEPALLGVAAKERLAEGFSVLKLKVGTDAAGDLARIRAVCEAAGSAATVRLDANQGWTADEAVAVIRELEDARVGVELVEQPTPRADRIGLAHVRAHVSTPVMADESLFDLADLVELLRLGAVDMVNVKLTKCGGLTAALELLDVARRHGLGLMVGSMMESHVGVGAAAALVAAVGEGCLADLDAAWWLKESPVAGGIHYARDRLLLPDGVGSGIGGLV